MIETNDYISEQYPDRVYLDPTLKNSRIFVCAGDINLQSLTSSTENSKGESNLRLRSTEVLYLCYLKITKLRSTGVLYSGRRICNI